MGAELMRSYTFKKIVLIKVNTVTTIKPNRAFPDVLVSME
jgi:hypothetical protein